MRDAKTIENDGFTLIEILVTLSILLIVVVGVLNLMTANVDLASRTGNKLIATTLAQESLELARNSRDSNWWAGQSWDAAWSDKAQVIFATDADGAMIVYVSDTGEEPLYKDRKARVYLSDNFYTQFDNEPPESPDLQTTNFYRKVYFSAGGEYSPGVVVTSKVTWQEGDDWKEVELSEVLYDWYGEMR